MRRCSSVSKQPRSSARSWPWGHSRKRTICISYLLSDKSHIWLTSCENESTLSLMPTRIYLHILLREAKRSFFSSDNGVVDSGRRGVIGEFLIFLLCPASCNPWIPFSRVRLPGASASPPDRFYQRSPGPFGFFIAQKVPDPDPGFL